MKEDKTVPQLRFPEFTDAWKQRKLSESAKFSKGNGYSKSDVTTKGIPLVLYGRLYTNYETVISNIDTYSELENEGSVVSKGGEIIVPASGETAEDISRASVIKDSGVLIGGDLNIICPSNDIIPSFLALTITYGNVHKEMTKLAQGKTVVHLHNSDLYKIRFFVPSYNEQLRITALFSNIESTITLQQRKLNSLQKLKKGLFQKMFPKNGENIPEIRFPEFSDAWKQRKVKELCSISTGKSNTQDKIDDGEYPFYVRSPIVEHSNKYLFDEEAVLTVGDGVGTGKVFHYVNGKYDLHQRCYRMFAFKEDLRAKYFYYIFSKLFYKRVMAMTAKTSVDSVRLEMISEMSIPVPSVAEQLKIESLLSELDNFITLQQRKLEFLQKLKKGLLQQMFI